MDVTKKNRRDASENGINRPKEHEICKVVAGLKQKAVLAQAILSSPDLLLLDEPTNGLDTDAKDASKRWFWKKFKEAVRLWWSVMIILLWSRR